MHHEQSNVVMMVPVWHMVKRAVGCHGSPDDAQFSVSTAHKAPNSSLDAARYHLRKTPHTFHVESRTTRGTNTDMSAEKFRNPAVS